MALVARSAGPRATLQSQVRTCLHSVQLSTAGRLSSIVVVVVVGVAPSKEAEEKEVGVVVGEGEEVVLREGNDHKTIQKCY